MATVYHRLVSLEEAVKRIENALGGIAPREVVEMDVADALGYIAAEDVYVKTSSPPFDRSSVDGYAVIASDTYSATENTPVKLRVVGKAAVGKLPETSISEGECVEISTGSPVPRGATAVVMVEYTKRLDEGHVLILKPVSPGENIAHTGSDLSVGDIALRRNQPITSREVAVLIAVGCERVKVYKKPAVTVFSTGDELTPVGKNLEEGRIYDVNGPAITAMLRELGFKATFMGILPDDYEAMRRALGDALKSSDVVITSGSTSAGFGDMIYKVFNELTEGNVIVHGLKLKPGKPTAIAVKDGKILFGLPGFPLSAMMVFLSLVKPVLLRLTGVLDVDAKAVNARMALRVEAGRGKHELLPVVVVEGVNGLAAYPLIGPSGSTSLLAAADGVVEVPENREFVDEGEEVRVRLLSEMIKPAELVFIGSHCPGFELLLSNLNTSNTKVVYVGSTAGWYAVKRGEADIAGTHLLDEKTGEYNVFMLDVTGLRGEAVLVRGYARRVGFLVQPGNPKNITGFKDLLRPDLRFVNRVRGSGVRTLTDAKLEELLKGEEPLDHVKGYDYEVKTHSAVAAAVAQGRADTGIAIEAVAQPYGLDFIPVAEEKYDFLIRRDRLSKPSISKLLTLLQSAEFAQKLETSLRGYRILPETGKFL
jgi:putative molybdopterin biosynthesis protein